jgi:hypothetical protein
MNVAIEVERRHLLVHSAFEFMGLIQRMINIINKREMDDRIDILLASSLKSIRHVQAIFMLLQDLHVEEMAVLLRTLAETVVNSAYLQYATEAELLAFKHHGPIARNIMMKDWEDSSGGAFFVPAELKRRTRERAEKASELSNLPMNRREWTRKNLFDRAKAISRWNSTWIRCVQVIWRWMIADIVKPHILSTELRKLCGIWLCS